MQNESTQLGTTKNGLPVYFDERSSHAKTHLSTNPKLLNAVIECLPSIEALTDVVRVECQLSYTVGTTDLVTTTESDEIIYALRPYRTRYSRFVKNKQSTATKWIVIDLRQSADSYFLYTCFIGRLTPSFPGGNYLPEQSKAFWSNHALVWGTQEILPESITSQCPW